MLTTHFQDNLSLVVIDRITLIHDSFNEHELVLHQPHKLLGNTTITWQFIKLPSLSDIHFDEEILNQEPLKCHRKSFYLQINTD